MKIFTIEDTKAKTHLQPFFAENAQVAVRLLTDPCNKLDHAFHKHATDYHLFQVGEWDDDKGIIEGFPKQHITSLEQIVELSERQPEMLRPVVGGE